MHVSVKFIQFVAYSTLRWSASDLGQIDGCVFEHAVDIERLFTDVVVRVSSVLQKNSRDDPANRSCIPFTPGQLRICLFAEIERRGETARDVELRRTSGTLGSHPG